MCIKFQVRRMNNVNASRVQHVTAYSQYQMPIHLMHKIIECPHAPTL